MYALIDCNNFFASCERVFDPGLKEKPVVVLSNNDGCVISRSNEAKRLGVKMGVPYYQIQSMCIRENIKVFSCNFELYGNISTRIMAILKSLTPQIEKYSIDEAFIDLSHIVPEKLEAYGMLIKKRIAKFIGMPVSVGIGASKTLAKVAASLAKNGNGVYLYKDEIDKNEVLKNTQLDDIWGFGNKTMVKLKLLGISNAYDFIKADSRLIRKVLTVVGLKTQLELRGTSCLKLEEIVQAKKQILSSRSFGKIITTLPLLEEAVATYISTAAEKLRKQNSYASTIGVYIKTNKYRTSDPQYRNIIYSKLPRPTNLTNELIHYSKILLGRIYKPNYGYYKAGIALCDITSTDHLQQSLLTHEVSAKQRNLMKVADSINCRYGKRILFWAASGVKQEWKMKREKKSPNYTGKWSDLPIVMAD